MSSAPTVSVCIPIYAAEPFVWETLESVRLQTHDDLEVICIDNASPDRSASIVEKFIRTSGDTRFRLLQNDRNLGMVGNWNRCLEEARGRYIKLLMADDYLEHDCLAEQVAALDKNPAVSLSSCARTIVNANGRRFFRRASLKREGFYEGHDLIAQCLEKGANLIGEPTATLFRRELLPRTGAFGATVHYFADLSLWLRLLVHGGLHFSQRSLCSFRVHGANATSQLRAGIVADFAKLADEIETYAPDAPRFSRPRTLRRVAFQSWMRSTVCRLLS